ncbi:PA14 domain-containing protein [Streptomyces sp. LE64]|uniref:PA14 domain-containing protein n=1 Tax=Streptomyces sp. LE64 TaxID=3448653 RepID=UPI004042A5DE
MNPARRTTTATAVVFAMAGGLLTAVVPAAPAAAAPNCPSPVFTRQFFAGAGFTGQPKRTDCDGSVKESWSGSPARGLPKDRFAVRWTVTRDFGSGGPFSFSVEARGGVRVYLDGARKVDLWNSDSATRRKTVNVTVPKGKHTLRVDLVNRTGPAKVGFGYAPRTSAQVDRVKPLVPTSPAVRYDRTSGKARISWAKNKEMDLAGYRVHRRVAGEAFPSRALVTTTATSYTDTPPATGRTYFYEVRAYDKAGNRSAGTADRGAVTVDRTPPAPVTGLSSTGTTAGNRVSWTASASGDTVHYAVRSSRAGAPDVPNGLAVVKGTSYHDAAAPVGQEVEYRVHAVDAYGNSSPVAVTRAARPAPAELPVPKATSGVPTDEATVITFDHAAGDGTDTHRFRLYQRRNTTEGWTLVTTVPSGGAGTARHATAQAGRTHYHLVAVDAQGREGAPSEAVTVDRETPVHPTPPSPPRLTVDREGAPRTGPFVVHVKPAAADVNRKLGGYQWEFSGACGSSNPQRAQGTAATLTWQPPWNGPCMLTVTALDHYGTRSGNPAVREFMIR